MVYEHKFREKNLNSMYIYDLEQAIFSGTRQGFCKPKFITVNQMLLLFLVFENTQTNDLSKQSLLFAFFVHFFSKP